MDEELACMSVEELIDFVSSHHRNLSSTSLHTILSELVRRALHALQDQKEGLSQHEEDNPNLSALYGDCCHAWLVGLLRSASLSVCSLAGATYLLALLTAGESKYADSFRSKVVNGCGILRLVALLSAQSPSIRFNALLALGNLLRHCPDIHSEFLRLGAVRKLALLFNQADEEPQKNVCLDAFLCLCNSNLSAMGQELMLARFMSQLLDWMNRGTTTRVALKAVQSISALLDKSLVRSAVLEFNLVQPLLSVLKYSDSKELDKVILELIESVCCSEDGIINRIYFVENGAVKILTCLIELHQNKHLLMQVIHMLAVLAVLDMKIRDEIIGMNSWLKFLQGLLRYHSKAKKGHVLQHREGTNDFELLPLQDDDVAAIRFLCKVCRNKFSSWKEPVFNAPSVPIMSGRMATRVGAE